jgi:hypothetical protein
VHLRKPTFLRWIEEAEGRQLREWALLEPDAPNSRVAPQPPFAAAVRSYCAVARILPIQPPPAKPTEQTQRDGRTDESLSYIERTRRA